MITRIFQDRHWSFQAFRYVVIGAVVFVVDVGLFQLFVARGLALAMAATVAYGSALWAHFLLNKFMNFRSHDRATHEQASTYLVVSLVCWLVTLAVITFATNVLRMPPLQAKLLAVVVNLPIGFISNRFLTFGPGIIARGRQFFFWQARK